MRLVKLCPLKKKEKKMEMDSIAMMTPPGQFYIRQKFNKVISVPEFVCVCVCVGVCVCVCIK